MSDEGRYADAHPNLFPGWWCSRSWPHDGPCALRPRWWNLRGRIAERRTR